MKTGDRLGKRLGCMMYVTCGVKHNGCSKKLLSDALLAVLDAILGCTRMYAFLEPISEAVLLKFRYH